MTKDINREVNLHAYDEARNKLTQTDAEGRTTRWTYDALGRQTSRTLPLGQTASTGTGIVVKYKVRIRIEGPGTAQIDARGNRTEMAYDVYSRLLSTTYPDGTTSTQSYDAEGNKLTDTDRLGRITRYTYDALNRVIKTTYPDGAEMANVYDVAGRMTSSTDATRQHHPLSIR